MLVPFAFQIVGWMLASDTNSTTTIDIWALPAAAATCPPTVTNTICGGIYPALAANTYAYGNTLTAWNTQFESAALTTKYNADTIVNDQNPIMLVFAPKTNNDATILRCSLIVKTGS
jgi:hypothetical protein